MKFTYELLREYSRSGCKDFADFMIIKQNVSKQKENMKNILIKFENQLLVNYVIDKLTKSLSLRQSAFSNLDIPRGKYKGIIIKNDTISTFNYNSVRANGYKEFNITSAANADIIIAEVVKEYNTPEYVDVYFGGHYNSQDLTIRVEKRGLRVLRRGSVIKEYGTIGAEWLINNIKVLLQHQNTELFGGKFQGNDVCVIKMPDGTNIFGTYYQMTAVVNEYTKLNG